MILRHVRRYIQGRDGIRKGEREYFYKINHQGMEFYFWPFNHLTTGKGHFWPTCFLTPGLSAWPLHKIQNVSNVKFKSLALVFNSKFDHKLFSSLKIT